MKTLMFYLSILLLSQLAGASERPVIKQLSLGEYHSCALIDREVKCWGRESLGAKVPEGLVNPTQIAAGHGHTCALTDEGVKCWGGGFDGTPKIFRNPIKIFSGSGSGDSCVIYDDNGYDIKCWRNDNGWYRRDGFLTATQASSGTNHNCALTNLGLQCWGSLYINSFEFSGWVSASPRKELRNVTQVASGWNHICALDGGQVVCWGDNWQGKSNVPSGLKRPSQIATGQDHTCALTDDGIKCWGNNFFGQTNVPAGLKNPTMIVAGADHTCAVTDDGIKCWGKNSDGQTTPPNDLSW